MVGTPPDAFASGRFAHPTPLLEEAGVAFTNGDAPGLRLRKKKR